MTKKFNSTLWALKYLLKENRLSRTQVAQQRVYGLITDTEAATLYKLLDTPNH